MFTGLVNHIGDILHIDSSTKHTTLTLKTTADFLRDVTLGDSIACNGVCLTVTSQNETDFTVDVSHETLKCTTLKTAQHGQKLNLEKALTLGARLGGHLVQGHVDSVAHIQSIQPEGNSLHFWILCPDNLTHYLIAKGSVTLDGISLTINEVQGHLFRITLIPHTLENTTAQDWQKGTSLNIEIDLMARYAEKLLSSHLDSQFPLQQRLKGTQ